MFARLKRMIFPPDEYALIRVKPDRSVIRRLDEPVTSLEAESQYGLEDGRYSLQEVRSGRFGACLWSEQFGNPQKAVETDELKREIAEIRRAVSAAGQPADFDDQLKRATFQSVLEGELDVTAAKQLAQLSAAFDNGGGKGLSETVEDPTNVTEIAGRSVLNLLDDPAKLEEFTKASGRATNLFLDSALGDVDFEQNGHQETQEEAASSTSQFDHLEGGPKTLDDLRDEEVAERHREDLEERESSTGDSEPRTPRTQELFEDLEDPDAEAVAEEPDRDDREDQEADDVVDEEPSPEEVAAAVFGDDAVDGEEPGEEVVADAD